MTSEEFGSELDGKVAIATGASLDIGSATAKPLASRRTNVVVAARHEGKLEEPATTIEDDGGDALTVPTDATVDDGIDALVKATLDEHDRIDILVNSVGLVPLAHIDEADHETLRTTIDVNFTGLITLAHAVVPTMMEQESGRIVDLSLVASRLLQANNSRCSTAKADVKMFSDSLRLDVAEAGIHVSSIGPGAVDTELLDHIPDEEVQKNVKGHISTMDVLAPKDIARVITFVVTQLKRVDINEVLIRPLDQVQP